MEGTLESKEKSKKGADRSRDTIFRVAARNQIELIAIADNKSNMIIGICVILISLVIALLGSGFVLQGTPLIAHLDLLIPLCILMFFALCSAVCAILAAKPEIIVSNSETLHSLLFFRNIAARTPAQYLADMHVLLSDQTATYDQMIVDMYFNGVILQRKYSLLRYAYILFMVGLIVSVVAFGITALTM